MHPGVAPASCALFWFFAAKQQSNFPVHHLDSVMVQILGRGAAEKDNADTSILSMVDENEAEYQAERLRKFATKFGSPRAAELLTEAHHVLFK